MNYDLLFAILFYVLLFYYFSRNKSKFEVHGKIVALYRTKLGLKAMDKFAKLSPRLLKFLGVVGVIVGFAGMIMISYMLIAGTYSLLFVKGTEPALAPVLPGVNIPGLPALSFWHWIVGIFLVAVVHEFAHGIYARVYNVKVKSSGFAIFGPILGAFVEPDEKVVKKKSKTAQLSIFAAGPFSNVIFAIIFLLTMNFVTNPLYEDFYQGNGIIVNEIMEGYPIADKNINAPLTINSINGITTNNISNFVLATKDIKPNQELEIETDQGNFKLTTAENPDNPERGFIGISGFEVVREIKQEKIDKHGSFVPKFVEWITMLVFWLFIINFGIGLFNLLPLGPIDGGRMLHVALLGIFKNKKTAKKIWLSVAYFFMILIFINLAPWVFKLLMWILKGFLFLFGIGL